MASLRSLTTTSTGETINHPCDQLSTTDLILEKIYSFINPILEKSKIKKVEAGENVDIVGKKGNGLFKIYTELYRIPQGKILPIYIKIINHKEINSSCRPQGTLIINTR